MAPNLRNWADIPEPLMAKILKGLPFSSLLALRRVCKTWGGVILSHASLFRPNPTVRHFLLAADGKDYVCYSPQKDQWFQGSLFPVEVSSHKLHLRASAGGLLLFVGDTGSFIVSNPLTKYYKELPRISGKGPEIKVSAMGICHHAPSRSYLIIVAESDFDNNGSAITALYNSLVGSWTITPGMKGKTFSHAFMHLAYSNGSFFGTVISAGQGKNQYCLSRYRIQQQTWSEGEVTLPRTVFPFLGEMDGHILLAARNIESKESREVSIWELSPVEGKWNLVNAMGMSLISYFSLVETIFAGDFLYWITRDYSSLLVHNLKRHSWDSARELPSDFDIVGSYYAFEPSLIATP